MSCSWPKCKKETELVYLSKELCSPHWAKICDAKSKEEEQKILNEIGLMRNSEGEVVKYRQEKVVDS